MILILITILGIPSIANGHVSIELFENVEVNNSTIYLRDIARIECENDKLKSKLSEIEITRVPLPGVPKTLDKDYIIIKLKQNKVNTDELSIKGTAKIVIIQSYMLLRTEDLIKDLKAFILSNYIFESKDVVIESMDIPKDYILPKGELSLRFKERIKSNLIGTVPFDIDILVDSKKYMSASITVKINQYRDIIVSSRFLPRNSILGISDIRKEKRISSSLPQDSVSEIDMVIGKQLSRAMNPREVITLNVLTTPFIMKKGDRVNIVIEKGGLRINAPGEAKEDGRMGQLIRVINMISKKEIYGRVESDKVVRINF